MPVWHRETKALRDAGKLVVVGIAQEQHPERTRLYKQWQQIDWPILWDPFNTTGSRAVPNFTLIDEHGIVRNTRPKLSALGEFMKATFDAPETPAPAPAKITNELIEMDQPVGNDLATAEKSAYLGALSVIIWGGVTPDRANMLWALDTAKSHPTDATYQFQAGVVLRMRHDSDAREPTDFQRAVDAWAAALKLNPSQYIWRRRIQQYGPFLDKPYRFYDWVNKAQADLRAKGETPVALRAALSVAEQAQPKSKTVAVEPDPEDGVPRADAGWIQVSTAVAFDTSSKRTNHAARVHLTLAPSSADGVKWNNEAQPLRVWLDRTSLPTGATLDSWDLRVENAKTAESTESRTVDFEVQLPAGTDTATLRGYALFNACTTKDGKCVYVRHDVTIQISR